LGSAGPGVHVTFNFSAACIACHGLSATTPTRFFLTTTRTLPGIPLTELSSTLATVAPIDGGRTMRPCSMPGTRTFWTCSNRPVASAGISTRGTDLPITVQLCAGFRFASFLIAMSKRLPPISSP
jgi:hypothetical protein